MSNKPTFKFPFDGLEIEWIDKPKPIKPTRTMSQIRRELVAAQNAGDIKQVEKLVIELRSIKVFQD